MALILISQTDTTLILLEAMRYIKFLQDQDQVKVQSLRIAIFLGVSQYIIGLGDCISYGLNATKYIKYIPVPILKELQKSFITNPRLLFVQRNNL